MKTALYFKYVRSIRFSFNPVADCSRATRLFMKRALAEKALTQNPNLQVLFDNSSRVVDPAVDVVYTDGTTLSFPTRRYNETDILLRVGKHTLKLRREDL